MNLEEIRTEFSKNLIYARLLKDIFQDEDIEVKLIGLSSNDLKDAIDFTIERLQPDKRKLLEMRYGMNGYCEHTYLQIADIVYSTAHACLYRISSTLNNIRKHKCIKRLKGMIYEE